MNTFDQFTNKYSLSKTLRFELKPVGKTAEVLKENGVFQKDEIIQKKYEQTKPFIDRMHREFVAEALKNVQLRNLNEYWDAFKSWQKDKKDKAVQKKLQDMEKELRLQVVDFFDAQAKEWHKKYPGTKKNTTGILDEKDVFAAILKKRYGQETESFLLDENNAFVLNEDGGRMSIFDEWDNFHGYFTKFFKTRENFYKADGKAGRIATRIIDQNLKRFCDNALLIQKIKENIDFSEVEREFGLKAQDMFSLKFYNSCLLQEGIDKYNEFVGGKTLEDGKKLRGVNELINEYRQRNKGEKIPFLKKLDKQILSEKDRFFIDEIEDDSELYATLGKFYKTAEEKLGIVKELFTDFEKNNEQYDLDRIYISREAFNTVTRHWTFEGESFEKRVYEIISQKDIKMAYESLRREKDDGVIKKEKDGYKFPSFIKLTHIKKALEKIEVDGVYASKENNEASERYFWKDVYAEKITSLSDRNLWQQFLAVHLFEFNSLFRRKAIIETEKDGKKVAQEVETGLDIFREEIEGKLKDFEKKRAKTAIKNYADGVLRVYRISKYFAVEKKRGWLDHYELDPLFYSHDAHGYQLFYQDAFEEIVQTYNKLRNYLTKKPFNQEKWKLNFENAELGGGWSKNKEQTFGCTILRKDKKFYLCVMKKRSVFSENNIVRSDYGFEKMTYQQLKTNVVTGTCYSKVFGTSYKQDKGSLSESEKIERVNKILEEYHYVDLYPVLQNIKSLKINKVFDLFNIIEQCYTVHFNEIVSESYIEDSLRKGDIYLFEICNKDWNDRRNGRMVGLKNLHTLYFENLFSVENVKSNFNLKLDGGAEIFYRPKTEKLKKEKIVTKKRKETIEKEIRGKQIEIFHKNRYTEDKIFLHVPIFLNRTKEDIPSKKFNAEINAFLSDKAGINIIGVDRGEKHLAYYSIINQKGEFLLPSKSLNEINDVNYAEKLESRAKSREQARRDWQEVEGIKDLKRGYISQVVRKLADLAIEHNAIIVLEDLNMRFKQVRGGIEKSVYQQLEKALIEKLNFLVNKGETDPKKAGHLLKAYQLAAPFSSFKDIGKQTGIIFYTQADYTSKIDPLTGWRPNLYLKYENAEKAKILIAKFDNIVFNADKNRFEFTYDLDKFFPNVEEKPGKTQWTVCSCVKRIRWNRELNQNKGGYDYYENLTDGKISNGNNSKDKVANFKDLFEEAGISCDGSILDQIEKLESRGNEKFFKSFIFLFNLMCQIRNTDQEKRGNESDYILSPVEPFFDSRKAEVFGTNLPKNGDENGAYNIARKGIIILEKISAYKKKNNNCDGLSWGDLYISKKEWDDFAQKIK